MNSSTVFETESCYSTDSQGNILNGRRATRKDLVYFYLSHTPGLHKPDLAPQMEHKMIISCRGLGKARGRRRLVVGERYSRRLNRKWYHGEDGTVRSK